MRLKHAFQIAAAVTAIGLVSVLAASDFARAGWSQTGRLQNEMESLQQVNAAVATRNRELSHSLSSLKRNQALLEQAAREDLGYIRDGEVVVVLPR